MDRQDQLQKLNDAALALRDSQARAWLLELFDEDTFVEIDRLARDGDKPAEAAAGYGLVEGSPVYAFAQDRGVCCGAVGQAQAAKILKIYEFAAQNGVPVVGIFDSDGIKLGEGIDAMDAVAEILAASNTLSGVVPQIAVIAGACVGSSAIIAANADVTVAAAEADYYLNPGDENGVDFADIVVTDASTAIAKTRLLLSLLPSNNLSAPAAYECDEAAGADCVSIDEVIDAIADPGTVLRLFSDGCEAALARVGGTVCGMVTLAGEKLSCHACSRLARFIRLCDGFTIPVLTFVDAEGFASVQGAAKLSHAFAEATTAKLTVIVGKAYGSVYIAAAGKAAGADMVLAWPTAVILPLAPETAVLILWKDRLKDLGNPIEDRKKLAEEFAETEGSALRAAARGYVTDVIEPEKTRAKLEALLDMLSGKRVSRLPKKHSNILL